jgi:hypothetical protein
MGRNCHARYESVPLVLRKPIVSFVPTIRHFLSTENGLPLRHEALATRFYVQSSTGGICRITRRENCDGDCQFTVSENGLRRGKQASRRATVSSLGEAVTRAFGIGRSAEFNR